MNHDAKKLATAVNALGFTKDGKKMSHCQAIEVMAKTSGVKSHAAALATKNPATNTSTIPAFPETLVVSEVFSTSEFGESPSWATIRLTAEMVSTIYQLRSIVTEHGLDMVAASESPEDWDDDAGHGSAFNIRDWQIYVTSSKFWFHGIPKHADYAVETRAVQFEMLEKVVFEGAEFSSIGSVDGVVYNDGSSFKGMCELYLSETALDEPVEWTNYYRCPCGNEWEDRHDCCCNDKCGACNKEIEPYFSDDGSASAEDISRAYESHFGSNS